MRFLLRVDLHARNHSAHPQAQSRVAALSACAAARSARVLQRRAPRMCPGSTSALRAHDNPVPTLVGTESLFLQLGSCSCSCVLENSYCRN